MTPTLPALRKIFPRAKEEWLHALLSEVTTTTNVFDEPNELASFLAQLDHESSGLTVFEENMSYSAQRLMQVWPTKFPVREIADKYEHVPERLANYVYANRMGNGDEASGDGWRYHGRGPIQLTGFNNYDKCGTAIGSDLINYPELLLLPAHGIRSAIWFWLANDLDQLDNDTDVRLETRKINGGETGLAHRQALFDRCLEILNKECAA